MTGLAYQDRFNIEHKKICVYDVLKTIRDDALKSISRGRQHDIMTFA